MFSRLGIACTCLFVLIFASVGLAQNVRFQIVPLSGVNPSNASTIVVQPGAVVGYQVHVSVITNPNFPTTAGLAGFTFNVLTTLGAPQTTPFTFAPTTSSVFATNQRTGQSVSDDLINISASQSLATGANINTGFGIGTRQLLGSGQLTTPSFEGDFDVDLTGNATLFELGTTRSTASATVAATDGFTISTRFAGSNTPVDTSTDNTTNTNGTSTGTTGGTVVQQQGSVSVGSSGAGNVPDPEQVGASIPEAPTTASLVPGFCGLGVVSSIAMTLLGLSLMKRPRT